MFRLILTTTEGEKIEEINEMIELSAVLEKYKDKYIGMQAVYLPGEVIKKIPEEEIKTEGKKYNTTTKITNFNVNWKNIKAACMTTISKDAGDKEPSHEWKRKLLLCEHSPIRRGTVSWKWEEIPYAISTHFARHHEGCEKFISTSRQDRTGVDRTTRSQMDPVKMEMDANIQALLNISYKRLCTCADPLTRQYWTSLVNEIKKYDEDIYWACVPQCVRCGGCPEYKNCGLFNSFAKDLSTSDLLDMNTRYDLYNEHRQKVLKK